VEDGGSGSRSGFARFPELASLVMHLTAREDVGNFCDGKGYEGFAALTGVGSEVADGAVVDPYSVCLVCSCVTHLARRQGANVSKASVGLSVPVSGLIATDALCVVYSLPNAMVQRRIRIHGMSLIVVEAVPGRLWSKMRLWGLIKAVVGGSPGTRGI